MKLSEARRGYQPTESQRRKVSATQKIAMNRPETREKSRVAHLGNKNAEGHIPSVETRERMSSSIRAAWSKLPEEKKARIVTAPHRYLQARAETSLERSVRRILETLGVEFQTQLPIAWWIVDFYISSKKLVIEADGEYWHSTPKARAHDRQKDAYLKNLGLTVLRLPERLILSGAEPSILEALS